MRLAVICASVLAVNFPSALSAAPADPKGPAILVIQKAVGRDFVHFSSFARCREAADLLQKQDELARDLAVAKRRDPPDELQYRCIPG